MISLRLSMEKKEWNALFPKVIIDEVAMQIEDNEVLIKQRGEIPLFRQHNYEDELKKSFVSQLDKWEEYLRGMLEKIETKVRSVVDIDYVMASGITINSTLATPMKLKDEYLEVEYANEFS